MANIKTALEAYANAKGIVFDPATWSTIDMGKRVPLQDNGVDCGIYAIMFADFLTDGLELTMTNLVIDFFRRKIAADLLRKRLNYGVPAP